jgi:glycerol-3-phosphate dehydrogenase
VPPDPGDIGYLLDACNGYFDVELGPGDLCGAYAGVRPLISSGDPKKSVDISRRAELYETPSGMLTITGGKLTTWRRMAKSTVDRIVERDGREAPCRTHEILLGEPASDDDLIAVDGVEDDTLGLLAQRYGHAARSVLELAASDPALAQRITPELPDLLAEAPFAARFEQARTVGDVLLRRTRAGLLAAPALCAPDAAAPRAVAQALAGELEWDGARVEQETEAWREEAAAEGIAQVGAVVR